MTFKEWDKILEGMAKQFFDEGNKDAYVGVEAVRLNLECNRPALVRGILEAFLNHDWDLINDPSSALKEILIESRIKEYEDFLSDAKGENDDNS